MDAWPIHRLLGITRARTAARAWLLTATAATARPVETIAVSTITLIAHHFARRPNGSPDFRQLNRRNAYADTTDSTNVPATAIQPGMTPTPLPCARPARTAGERSPRPIVAGHSGSIQA